MKATLSFLLLFGISFAPISLLTADNEKEEAPISSKEAHKYINQIKSVVGKVEQVRTSGSDNLFLNIDGKFPDQPFTVVIFRRDRERFPEKFEESVREKNIQVRGRITLFQEKPQIVINRPDMLKILPDEKKDSDGKSKSHENSKSHTKPDAKHKDHHHHKPDAKPTDQHKAKTEHTHKPKQDAPKSK